MEVHAAAVDAANHREGGIHRHSSPMMNSADVQDVHDGVVLIKYEPRPPAPGSWEEASATIGARGTPQRRSARLSAGFTGTLDGRTSGQLRNTLSRAREFCEKWRGGGAAAASGAAAGAVSPRAGSPPPSAGPPNGAAAPPHAALDDDSPGGRLSRWFSVRRGSQHHYDMSDGANAGQDKMPGLPELEEEFSVCRRMSPPALPPPPPNLSTQQLRRRHIVAAIIHSENSYVATLQRLVNDYKKPLEQSSPVILSGSKVSTLFHRLPEILQSHTQFRTALTDCARTWDKDEKIGDVFLTAFSRAVVLDVYSDFINNFSMAMELAKMESKRKSALADFFKVKQISAHDRLSFFGLMVKPVQRFPQFIMFLQDLLKHTPPGHVDRMALQRALTRLEALADALNESKRDAERTQAFRATLRRLGGRSGMGVGSATLTSGTSAAAGGGTAGGVGAAGARLVATHSDRRHLLRQDDVALLEFAAGGALSKVKQRRLLLLNDLVVCVSVQQRPGANTSSSTSSSVYSVSQPEERLNLKWAYPVTDVEIIDSSSSPTLSRMLAASLNRGGSLRSNSSSGRESTASMGDSLCTEMSMLMHDYEAVSRMADIAAGLKANYPELSSDVFKKLLQHIQQSIQKKDDEMSQTDGCLLQLSIRGGRGGDYAFRTESASSRAAWSATLRAARLAAAPGNAPAWRAPPHSAHKHFKTPLFVGVHSVFSSRHLTEVRCGCFYASGGSPASGSMRSRRPRGILWLCAADGASSHITVLSQPTTAQQHATTLKTITTFDLVETQVTSMEYVKGLKQSNSNNMDTVWLGTDNRKIILFAASEPEKQEKVAETGVPASVLHIKYHCDCVFVALTNGNLLVYRRGSDSAWLLQDPVSVVLGKEPVMCLLPINGIVYASSGLKVFVINSLTAEILRTLDILSENHNSIAYMAHSGVGLWISLKNSTAVRLYHSETFEHIQDIDIANDVAKTIGAREGTKPAHVSALLACQGLLWVGTTAGVSLTVPLPRLEGLPMISGHTNVSFHAHAGSVSFLLSLQPENHNLDANVVRQNISNARASKETNNNRDINIEMENEKHSLPEKRGFEGNKIERQISEDLSISSTPNKPLVIHGRGGTSSRRRGRGLDARLSKTLPRGASGAGGALDVYGLYGDLMFVKDCVGETDGSGAGGDSLRRSDPELATIPARVNTLDRRLRMRAGRPRSLDLSNWSVDSRTSSLCTSSGSEESMALRSISRNSSNASRTADFTMTLNSYNNSFLDTASSKSSASDGTPDKSVSRSNSLVKEHQEVIMEETQPVKSLARSVKVSDYNNSSSNEPAPRSVITIMGGRGYVDWRQVADASERPTPSADPNPKDAHIIMWEMRL